MKRGAVFVALALAGCSDDDLTLPPGPPVLPEHCGVLGDAPSLIVLEMYFFPSELGLFVAWIERDPSADPDNPGLVIAPIGDDGTPGPMLRSTLVSTPASELGEPRIIAPIGDRALVVAGTFSALYSLQDPNGEDILTFDLPDMAAVETVELGDGRLGLLSREPSNDVAYRLFDPTSLAASEPISFEEQANSVAAPGFIGQSARTIRLMRLGDDRLFGAWVTPNGMTLRGMVIDEDGVVVHPPTDLAVADAGKRVFVPNPRVLPDGRIALVWTGEGGTEVRAKVIGADLENIAPGDGAIVNATTEGSQEFGHPVQIDGELAAFWTTINGPLSARSLTTTGSGVEPTGEDLDPVGGCSGQVEGEPAVATGPLGPLVIWKDIGWKGPARLVVEPIAP